MYSDCSGLGKLPSYDLGMYLHAYSGIRERTAGFVDLQSPSFLKNAFSSFSSGGLTATDEELEEGTGAESDKLIILSVLRLDLAEVKSTSYIGT